MTYTLLVYNRSEGRLLSERAFTQRASALAARFEAEREHPGENIEVVVLGARSRDDLMRTHSRYFLSLGQLADQAV